MKTNADPKYWFLPNGTGIVPSGGTVLANYQLHKSDEIENSLEDTSIPLVYLYGVEYCTVGTVP
jgi:hypothetical protein